MATVITVSSVMMSWGVSSRLSTSAVMSGLLLVGVAVSYWSRVAGMLREPETILLVVVVEQVWVESNGAPELIW
jgi:hypothetical protein